MRKVLFLCLLLVCGKVFAFDGVVGVTNGTTTLGTGPSGGVINDTFVTNLYTTNLFATNAYINEFHGHTVITTNLYSSNAYFTNIYVTANETYYTNSGTQAPDFAKGYQLFATNAAFTFLAPIGVDTTKLQAQTAVVVVTNSTAAAVLVSPPASVFQQGTWYVTNVTTFTFFTYASVFTNAYAIPLY